MCIIKKRYDKRYAFPSEKCCSRFRLWCACFSERWVDVYYPWSIFFSINIHKLLSSSIFQRIFTFCISLNVKREKYVEIKNVDNISLMIKCVTLQKVCSYVYLHCSICRTFSPGFNSCEYFGFEVTVEDLLLTSGSNGVQNGLDSKKVRQ